VIEVGLGTYEDDEDTKHYVRQIIVDTRSLSDQSKTKMEEEIEKSKNKIEELSKTSSILKKILKIKNGEYPYFVHLWTTSGWLGARGDKLSLCRKN